MGKALSVFGKQATRSVKSYNIEERAHKAISKTDRPKAPRHESTARIIEESVRNMPEEVKTGLKEKDSELLNRLKSVYVTSKDVTPQAKVSEPTSKRPLPLDRSNVDDPEYGFHEPLKTTYGKVTLRNALDFIGKHQQDPENWTANRIAYEYKLDLGLTEKVLKHFRTFLLVVPKDKQITQAMLSASPITDTKRLISSPATSNTKEDSKDDGSKS